MDVFFFFKLQNLLVIVKNCQPVLFTHCYVFWLFKQLYCSDLQCGFILMEVQTPKIPTYILLNSLFYVYGL